MVQPNELELSCGGAAAVGSNSGLGLCRVRGRHDKANQQAGQVCKRLGLGVSELWPRLRIAGSVAKPIGVVNVLLEDRSVGVSSFDHFHEEFSIGGKVLIAAS